MATSDLQPTGYSVNVGDLLDQSKFGPWNKKVLLLYLMALMLGGGSYTYNAFALGEINFKCSKNALQGTPFEKAEIRFGECDVSITDEYNITHSMECKEFVYFPGQYFRTSGKLRM